MGRMVRAARTLKKSWTVDAAKALWNSAGRVTWPMETSVFVVVVPIFAPMTMGTASSMVRAPEATSPTTMVVVVEELWMIPVATNPRMRPATGSDTVLMSCSANPRPAILKAVLINSMLVKNR